MEGDNIGETADDWTDQCGEAVCFCACIDYGRRSRVCALDLSHKQWIIRQVADKENIQNSPVPLPICAVNDKDLLE